MTGGAEENQEKPHARFVLTTMRIQFMVFRDVMSNSDVQKKQRGGSKVLRNVGITTRRHNSEHQEKKKTLSDIQYTGQHLNLELPEYEIGVPSLKREV
jgi:hypothetical protein